LESAVARDGTSATERAIDALRDMSPSERLMGLYRYGMEGCRRRDAAQVTAVLDELIGSLDYGSGEVAEGFYRLYSACLDKCRRGQFADVAWVLRELQGVWQAAFADSLAIPEIPLLSGDATRARAARFDTRVGAAM
jgi:hypothetical protein